MKSNLPFIAVLSVAIIAFHWVITEFDWDITEPIGFTIWVLVYLAGWWFLEFVLLGVRMKDLLYRRRTEPAVDAAIFFTALLMFFFFWLLSDVFFNVDLLRLL